MIPEKMPVISIAAPNIPAVDAYCGSTLCGAYIMPRELQLGQIKKQLYRCQRKKYLPTHLKYPEEKLMAMAMIQYAQSLWMYTGIMRSMSRG